MMLAELRKEAAQKELARRKFRSFKPRKYQRPFLNAFLGDGPDRASICWHRRAGKDKTSAHAMLEKSKQRIGTYWHMFPVQTQARKAIWAGIDEFTGKPILDEWFPPESVVRKNGTEMLVELSWGSRFHLVGSDNFNTLVGSPPVGVVFSEWALSNPLAWDYIRPIIRANNGAVIQNFTPRGMNHAHKSHQMAKGNDAWFAETLTIDDTGVLTEADMDEERAEGMAEELIQQEYYCSFEAPLVGSIYGDQVALAMKEDRLGRVIHDESLEVHTAWDLGRSDATAIIAFQVVLNEYHILNYHEANGQDLRYYADVLDNWAGNHGYRYGTHVWPHDGGHQRLALDDRALNVQFEDTGYEVEVQPRQSDVWNGIQRARAIFNRCFFDEVKCEQLIEALKNYRKEEDENRSTIQNRFFKDTPYHDWSSHGASAFSEMARWQVTSPRNRRRPPVLPKRGVV